nr:hypothetical protein [Tanacetum cinerariifolium]
MELVCCVGSGENSGDVTEVGEKRMAGISGLTATVDAIQTGKKTLLLGVWNFDNISPSVHSRAARSVLLTPVPELWLSSPFVLLRATRAAKAAVTP